MFPFRDGSTPRRNPPANTGGSGSGSAGSGDGPGLPSIRVLDPTLGYEATREADLEHGPLLRGLGESSKELDPTIYSGELDLETSGEQSAFSKGRASFPSSSFPLQLRTRSGGPSLPPVEDSATISAPSARDFSTIGDSLPAVEEQEPSTSKNSEPSLPPLLPWRYEFSWGESGLAYDSEPLQPAKSSVSNPSVSAHRGSIGEHMQWSAEPEAIAQSLSPADHARPPPLLHDLAGIGYLGEANTESFSDDELEIDSDKESICSSGFGDNFQGLDGLVVEIADELNDYYVRHYTRQQGSGGQSSQRTRGRSDNADASGDSSDRGEPPGKRRRLSGQGHRRITGNEDHGEDDGEDGEEERGKVSPNQELVMNDFYRFACPFYKWKPAEHSSCAKRKLKAIRHVKQHLFKDHYENYCQTCFHCYGRKRQDHDCSVRRCRPAWDCLSEEQYNTLQNHRASKKLSKPEQWTEIFELVIPEIPDPFPSPYMHSKQEPAYFVALPSTQEWLVRRLRQANCPDEIIDTIRHQIAVELLQMYNSPQDIGTTIPPSPASHETYTPSTPTTLRPQKASLPVVTGFSELVPPKMGDTTVQQDDDGLISFTGLGSVHPESNSGTARSKGKQVATYQTEIDLATDLEPFPTATTSEAFLNLDLDLDLDFDLDYDCSVGEEPWSHCAIEAYDDNET